MVNGSWRKAVSWEHIFSLTCQDLIGHGIVCNFHFGKREDVNVPVMTTRMYGIDWERSRFASVLTVADHYTNSSAVPVLQRFTRL